MLSKYISGPHAACLLFLTVLTTTANATLIGRLPATPGGTDYQAYYDDVAGLTWLADANYSYTSGGEGIYDWGSAIEWVTYLTVDGVDGWRLPTALNGDGSGPCSGYGCAGSELGNMFYNVLGGVAYSSIETTHNANYDLFSNIGYPYAGHMTYWTGTERIDSTTSAWIFRLDTGETRSLNKSTAGFAWAVHDGDVGAVPVPAAIWLFGTGLIGLISIANKKAA